MLDWLLDPFVHGYMQRAIIAVLFCAVACAWLGVHIILRRLSFFGDALAHATLPGVLLSVLFGWPLLLGALVGALAAVAGISWATRSEQTSEDSSIGVVYTGLFAGGILGMYHLAPEKDLTHLLIGEPLAVTNADLQVIAGCSLAAMLCLTVGHRLLATTLIDARFARSIGHPPQLARLLILLTSAVVVVVALSVTGAVLTIACIITPAATARLCCRRLGSCIALAIAIACFCGYGGILAAWHGNWPIGASIVVFMTGVFGLVRLGRGLLPLLMQRVKPSN